MQAGRRLPGPETLELVRRDHDDRIAAANRHALRPTGRRKLKAKRYADKYRDLGEPIHLVAVEFSRETRNVVAFEVERA